MDKKLYRDEQHKVIGGVCAGLADYFNIDVSIVRVVFALSLLLKGGGSLLYVIMWWVLPKKPYGFTANPIVDYTVPTGDVPPPPEPFDYRVPTGGMPNPPRPFAPMPPLKPKSNTAGLIIGVVLVLFGSFFLLNEFNLIPSLDFDQFWPVVLIIAGAVLVFSGKKKEPWEKAGWQNPEEPIKEEKSPIE